MQKRIESLQAQKQEKWNMNCSLHLFQPKPDSKDIRELYIATFGDSPNTCYLLLKDQILQADRDMIAIVEKIKIYKQRQTIVVSGFQYKVGDFIVRVGSIILGSNTKGLLMEIEYTACCTPNACHEILAEFIDLLRPIDQMISPLVTFDDIGSLPSFYSLQHATLQYVTLFKRLGLVAPH